MHYCWPRLIQKAPKVARVCNEVGCRSHAAKGALGEPSGLDTMRPGPSGKRMSSSTPTVCSRPQTISQAVHALVLAQPRFVEIAQDLHANACDWVRQLEQLRRQCSLQWALVPDRDFPEASREDVLGLALCSLEHVLALDPDCTPHRRAVIASSLARRAHADPLAPLLHLISQSSREMKGDDLDASRLQIQPLLDLVGSVLATQAESQCGADYQRVLDALSVPGSVFSLSTDGSHSPRLLKMTAKLAICNALMRTPGMGQSRREQVLHATSCFGVVSAPSPHACNDPQRLAPTG